MVVHVLMLTTYPIKVPRHGGQIRAFNIKRMYEQNGYKVTLVSVREQDSYVNEYDTYYDIPFANGSCYRRFCGIDVPYITDLQSGEFIVKDKCAWNKMVSICPAHVDVIHLEQPWLYEAAARLKHEKYSNRPVLIYSSQNIENELKKKILCFYSNPMKDQVIERILSLEKTCASEADLTIVVSSYDASVLREYGAKKIILALNGVEDRVVSHEVQLSVKSSLPKEPFALYIASGHPPNATGFFSIFNNSLAFLPPDRKIVVLGGVCDLIRHSSQQRRWKEINASRLSMWGGVTNKELDAIKSLAHVIVLPITSGGGSNLKSAEALRSNSYVLGTTTSFRGFESHSSLPGTYIKDDPIEFQCCLRDLLDASPFVDEELRKKSTEALVWKQCLKDVVIKVDEMVKKNVNMA